MSQSNLTDEQRARINENRERALALRRNRPHPYKSNDVAPTPISREVKGMRGAKEVQINGSRYLDSGGGFLLEAPPREPTEQEMIDELVRDFPLDEVELPVQLEECLECGAPFSQSHLLNTFGLKVCDGCRDDEERHTLITRTAAKNDFLLKDCDFDRREPPLRYIIKKNPHNPRWGEMKLYLLTQVEARAMEVWGTMETLESEKELRQVKREQSKQKKYSKELKQLRMQVRSSLYDRTSAGPHKHEFGPEYYNEEEDNYSHECACGYSETFEKM